MKKLLSLLLIVLCFSIIGLSQNPNYSPNDKLKIEILEKMITKDSMVFIDYPLQMENGQISGVSEAKEERVPKKGFAFVTAKVKLTNNTKKTLKILCQKSLIAKNQNGITNDIYINYYPNKIKSYQRNYYENGLLGPIGYELKGYETKIIDILVELPENSEQLIIEYKK
jgi:hypothetical protein